MTHSPSKRLGPVGIWVTFWFFCSAISSLCLFFIRRCLVCVYLLDVKYTCVHVYISYILKKFHSEHFHVFLEVLCEIALIALWPSAQPYPLLAPAPCCSGPCAFPPASPVDRQLWAQWSDPPPTALCPGPVRSKALYLWTLQFLNV